jgi:hypothetical protein
MGYDKPILRRPASIDVLTDITEQLEILGISISVINGNPNAVHPRRFNTTC